MRKTLIVVLFIAFLNIGPAFSQVSEIVDTKPEGFFPYISKTLPKNLLLGTKNTFSFWNVAILGTAAGGSLILSQTDADEDIQDSLSGSLGGFADIGNIAGNGLTLAGITITSYLYGEVSDNEKFLETSKALIEAQIITAVMTGGLKLAVGRERPDGSGSRINSSFPSGHVSGSFAMASVFDSMYGYKVGIPLYTFAGFVGLSRISDNKHFLSDVLFGAALGTVVGRSVAKMHLGEKNNRFTILPHTDGRSTGLVLTLTW